MDHFAWEKPFFKNREEAARLLAGRLVDYKGKNPLVLAIPRGAVPMGRIIADELKGELDVVLVHKVGAPGNPELALGAVSESGEYYEGPYARSMGFSEEKVQAEIQRQVKALKEKRKLYGLGAKSRIDKRVVVLVDDGIATASTMMAAIREVRRQGPLKVIVAASVAPPEAMDALHKEADEVVVLKVESNFGAVGEFFEDFRQVNDWEVIQILKNPKASQKV